MQSEIFRKGASPPDLLPFLSVGVGPYVIWETTESTDEEFDLKLHNRSCLILRNSNSTREREEAYERSISGRVTRTPACVPTMIFSIFHSFFFTNPRNSAAMLCAVRQLRPCVATTTSWTWVPAYSGQHVSIFFI